MENQLKLISADIDRLSKRRETIRAEEKQLTQNIQALRIKGVEARKAVRQQVKNNAPKLKQLLAENRKLLGMVSIYDKAQGNTYAKIGDKLGVGAGRARDIVQRQLYELKLMSWKGEA